MNKLFIVALLFLGAGFAAAQEQEPAPTVTDFSACEALEARAQEAADAFQRFMGAAYPADDSKDVIALAAGEIFLRGATSNKGRDFASVHSDYVDWVRLSEQSLHFMRHDLANYRDSGCRENMYRNWVEQRIATLNYYSNPLPEEREQAEEARNYVRRMLAELDKRARDYLNE